MKNLNVVVSLITSDNDYQMEQATAAQEAAQRLGMTLHVMYAGNDAVNQSQQLLQLIQDRNQRPDAIVVEPVGTGMVQVARAANLAGIGWAVINREVEYISELHQARRAPVFGISTDQEEVGKIQGKQFGVMVREGNVLYLEGPSSGSVARLRTKGMQSSKPADVNVKSLKGDWTKASAYHAVKSWLSLSTSRQLQIRAVGCQNDAMAIGARDAFEELPESQGREQWRNTPFTGCDGVTRTGQEWVRRGLLCATVVTPPTAGVALEVMAQAIHSGSQPPERTLTVPRSYPPLEELAAKYAKKAQAATP
jgi:ribose transport system substrate-binding protein